MRLKGDNKNQRRSIVLGEHAMEILNPDTSEPVEIARGFEMTHNGLRIIGEPPVNRWETVGRKLSTTERGVQFAMGDYLNALYERLGEDQYNQIVDYSDGWSDKTCQVYRWLAARVPMQNRRMDRLGIKHHLLVASLSHEKQKEWLDRAAEGDTDGEAWTSARLKAALEAGEDMPIDSYWVLVSATDESDQAAIQSELEGKGRQTKAVVKRQRKKKELSEAPAGADNAAATE